MTGRRTASARRAVVLALAIVASLVPAPSPAEVPVATIDLFVTGRQAPVTLRGGERREVRRGAMPGGFRLTRFSVEAREPVPPRPGSVAVEKGCLSVEAGVGVAHRLEVRYGVDGEGAAAPLAPPLRLAHVFATGGFSLRFVSLSSSLEVAVELVGGAGEAFRLEKEIEPGTGPLALEFPLAAFVSVRSGRPAAPADLADVVSIAVSFAGEGVGDHAYSVDALLVDAGALPPSAPSRVTRPR